MKISPESRRMQRYEGLRRARFMSELTEEGRWDINGKEIPEYLRAVVNPSKLEASHIDHNKWDAEIYLSPDSIIICTPLEHYVYHLLFRNNPELIGLTREQNNYAIRQTWERALRYMQEEYGIEWSELSREEKEKILNRIKLYWSMYLSVDFES
jgi:hypothetical protein